MHAEKDLKGFLIASALAMITGYHTSNDVLKQVSHRGAIRMPAYMAKGKCRRGLLAQFAVQREPEPRNWMMAHSRFGGFILGGWFLVSLDINKIRHLHYL